MTILEGAASAADLWRRDAAAIVAVLRAVDAAGGWEQPSACAGWSAADVLDHVLTTQGGMLAERQVALPVGVGTLEEGARPGDGWAAAAAAQFAAIGALLDDPAVRDRAYDGYFGPTTIGATLSRFYGFDLMVHRWDIARAIGRDELFTESELDRIEASALSFGDNLHMEGICAPPLEVGADADRQTRLLALLGRSVA